MRILLARLRRRHDAYWVAVRYMEPYGVPTFAICVVGDGFDYELTRHRWRWRAIWMALTLGDTDD